ncbi:hypothetical protein CEXT_234961 [Caerostris extrusa]|uniref:Uncharacterized protein n=1 Tax=Caerostris extrusa TaxID=172846 RepID=A0AAV4N815_CAEEX|nr:hypothetical protein CEXT_234961 [Caerostris extrusa]
MLRIITASPPDMELKKGKQDRKKYFRPRSGMSKNTKYIDGKPLRTIRMIGTISGFCQVQKINWIAGFLTTLTLESGLITEKGDTIERRQKVNKVRLTVPSVAKVGDHVPHSPPNLVTLFTLSIPPPFRLTT